MRVFLFRNSVNPIEYCATATRNSVRLPALRPKARWLYRTEIQNAMHAAIFGITNYEATTRAVLGKGYFRYVEVREPRNVHQASASS